MRSESIMTNKLLQGGVIWILLSIGLILSLNQSIAYFVDQFGLFYITNRFIFGLQVNVLGIALILWFVTYGIISLGCLQSNSLASVLILAGAWSNFLERVIRGSVVDYIPFLDGYINLADIMLWIGLILLIIQTWFFQKKTDPLL